MLDQKKPIDLFACRIKTLTDIEIEDNFLVYIDFIKEDFDQ